MVGLFQEDGIQGWIELFSYVLEQHWLAELDGVFEGPEEVGIGELDDVDAATDLHLLDPFVGLALRVDAERPSSRLEDDNTVFEGEVVGRQAVDVPLPHLHRVAQDVDQREVFGTRDLLCFCLVDPLIDDLRTEGGSKGSKISNFS